MVGLSRTWTRNLTPNNEIMHQMTEGDEGRLSHHVRGGGGGSADSSVMADFMRLW